MTTTDANSPPAPGPPAAAADGPPGPPPDEFAGIPSRQGRHPVVAAAAVALAGFLIFQMRSDLGYALSSAAPRDLGDARSLARAPADAVPANRYVRVAGPADRESAILLDTRGSWDFTQFFRLLGTENRVFVHRSADPLPVHLAERDIFTGRLIRFRDLSFQAAIRQHFTAHVTATHFFRPEDLRAAVTRGGHGPLQLADRLGEQVSLAPEQRLAIDIARPGEIRLEVPAARAPDGAAARALIEKQGGQVVSVQPWSPPAGQREARPGHHVVIARFPAGTRDRALAALADLDRQLRIAAARSTLEVRVRDLKPHADGVEAAPEGTAAQVVALADIAAVRSLASVAIPQDAWLLVEGTRPRDHLKTVLAAVFVAGFALINLLALRRLT